VSFPITTRTTRHLSPGQSSTRIAIDEVARRYGLNNRRDLASTSIATHAWLLRTGQSKLELANTGAGTTAWSRTRGQLPRSIAIFGAAQTQAESQHRAIVARVDRLTRLAKYCGFASLGLLLITGGVWVYRGIVAVNLGRTP
jgi:hypothetical protein